MTRIRIWLLRGLAALPVSATLLAQPPKTPAPPPVGIEQPDAQRTREELSRLLDRYPPALKGILALDPSLLNNQTYLAPYPALWSYLNLHPEIARNPSFYTGAYERGYRQERPVDLRREVLNSLSIFAGFAMAIGLFVWLIRTFIDYRRWIRLAKTQTEVHTKLLDRFTQNDDLLAYIQSPAGSKFLQSSPITLDAGSRTMGAPLGRILWSVQAGLVVFAAGVGLRVVSGQASDESSQTLYGLAVLGIALGLGLVISAAVSYVISHRLGLIDTPAGAPRTDAAGPQG